MKDINQKYLSLLSQQFDSVEAVMSEIINLKAIQRLPKGTEHFVSDLHGEYDAFQHLMRNGSGNIKEKIKDCFGDALSLNEQRELSTLIYYPEERLKVIDTNKSDDWYRCKINELITLTRFSAKKYTRSKLRKSFPSRFSYIIEELMYPTQRNGDKKEYYEQIIEDLIYLNLADSIIIDLSYTIQRLVIDHLHVVGDIYDRGPAPDKIMESLIQYHSLDIQWGNHDIIWIGAASGSLICMMTIIRICARYDNLDILEDTYGINLRPLLTLAEKHYTDNPAFRPKQNQGSSKDPHALLEITKIHQAAAIIQFKLEEQLISRRPSFQLEHRCLLRQLTPFSTDIKIDGKTYELTNTCFQTINYDQPGQLTNEERDVVHRLQDNFVHSEKLQRHMDFLMEKGSMYLVYNDNLLIHGCIPLNEDGSLKTVNVDGNEYKGKELLDFYEVSVREAYADKQSTTDFNTDLFWYLWSGEGSSLFGKKEMTTFERYFITDTSTHLEKKNPYYHLREQENVIIQLLKEFGLAHPDSHLINGHTPVKEIKGEQPIKANGRMIVIDGGFSAPYRATTGVAGYTLLYNSYGMQLATHEPFTTKDEAIHHHRDMISIKRLVDKPLERKFVKDTTIGRRLNEQIHDLRKLLIYLQKKS